MLRNGFLLCKMSNRTKPFNFGAALKGISRVTFAARKEKGEKKKGEPGNLEEEKAKTSFQ